MLFKSACRRFRRIDANAREMEISRAEQDFLTAHARGCNRCRVHSGELDVVSAALSASAFDPIVISPDFTENVVRGVRAMRREGHRNAYRPVLVGAGAAFVALGAILQVVGAQAPAPTTDGTAGVGVYRESPLKSTSPSELNLFDAPSRLVRDPRPHDV